MLKFISFGSGSCGNCYYLYNDTDGEGLLIDCGVGTRTLKKSFHDYGLHFQDGFKAILVTHDHADHIKSVGSLAKKSGVTVYATRAVHDGMDNNYCMRCKIARQQRGYVEKGNVFSVGRFRVMPFGVPHDSSDNVGYTIECDGVVFTVLTDVGHITDEMHAIIQGSDYLVIEANYDPAMLESGPYSRYLQDRIRCGTGHLSNDQCAETLAADATDRLRHVWLCHLSGDNNRPEIAYECVSSALCRAGFGVGEGLKLDVLRRKLPTGVFDL